MGSSTQPDTLWALKCIVILSPWGLPNFWRRYLHELLNIAAPATSLEGRLSQANEFLARGGAGLSSTELPWPLLPRRGRLPAVDREKLLPSFSDGADGTLPVMTHSGSIWAKLPQTLILCIVPMAVSAATAAAAATPLLGVQHVPRDAPPPPLSSSSAADSEGLRQLQQQQEAAALELVVGWLSPQTLCSLLAALLAEWNVLLYCRDATKLSHVCNALLLILRPLAWQGGCLPLLPRTRAGAPLLSKLRDQSDVPLLIGVLQPTHASPPSTPQSPRTLHVQLPSGSIQPTASKEATEAVPQLPPALESALMGALCAAAHYSTKLVRGQPHPPDGSNEALGDALPMPIPATRHRVGSIRPETDEGSDDDTPLQVRLQTTAEGRRVACTDDTRQRG